MTSMFKLKKIPTLLGGFGLSTLTLTASAADWIVSPAVTLEQNYTDNAFLTHDDEENESITIVRPSISLYREGGRATVDLNYAPEYRYYHEETEDDELVHFLRGEGNVELLEERLYLDGWATADLTTITSSGRTGLGGLTGRADSTEVYTAGISPYFKARFGNASLFEARYALDTISYSEEGLDDSVGQRGDLVLGSGPAFTNQVWELSAMHSQVDYDELEQDNEISQFRAEFAQQLIRQLALAFAAGYEEYDLVLNEDVDDSLWSVGIIYTPNPRTRLAIGGGERSFGDDYYLDFSHRSPRTIWTASYEREYTSARGELLRPTLFQRQDAFGNLVRDAVLESPLMVDRSGAPSPTISAEFYELRRFITRFTLATGRTTLDLGGTHAERDYADDVDDTRDLVLTARLTRDISPQTSAYLDLRGTDHEEDTVDYEQWVAALGGSYELGVSTVLGMRLAHLERDADSETDSYEENSFTLYLTALF
jgi:uncharacterized protein (PEP-CTERM system associated)